MKGYRTILFNLGMLAVSSPDLLALIPPRAALYTAVIGNLVLRAATTGPVPILASVTSSKESEKDGPK